MIIRYDGTTTIATAKEITLSVMSQDFDDVKTVFDAVTNRVVVTLTIKDKARHIL
jgi:hypothetical protein